MARYLLVDAKKGKENKNKKAAYPLKGAYRKHLAETTMMDRTRILSFWRKPPAPTNTNGNFQEETVLANLVKSSQQKRHIPKSADRTLVAPKLIDDYYLNLLDWSTGNILAIALGNTVYLWNASIGSSSKLLTVDEEHGPVTSVSWAPGGQHIVVGLNSSVVDLWDTIANRKLTTLQGEGIKVGWVHFLGTIRFSQREDRIP